MKDLHLKKAREIAELVNSKQISALEVAQYFIKRAAELNPKLNAFNSITPELALEQAKKVDERIAKGEKLLLAGVPIGIKDNLCVKGTNTTCSSKILENFVSPYESTVTSRLWDAGAVCIGKTNLDEFAMGSSTEYSAFGPSRNPWNLDCVPGGSSGGSAVAVSGRLVPVALGSDTGGSIRQPASLCGITGMKPTYGLVSRFGLIAFASSLDQIGPFATDTEDMNLILSVIAGHDDKDSTSLPVNYEYKTLETKKESIKNLRIGLVKEMMLSDENTTGSAAEVSKSIQKAVDFFKSQGCEFKEISMPLTSKYSLDCYYIIAPAEASSNLARYDGVRYGKRTENPEDLYSLYVNSRSEGFGKEVKRRIIIGTYVLSAGYYDAYYKKAQKVRKLISEEYAQAFKEVDIILTPTSPVTAFPFGSKTENPLDMYLLDILTIPVNLAGLPALSINCGFDSNNLPIGLQLVAPAMKDRELLEIASFYETNAEEFASRSAVPSCCV